MPPQKKPYEGKKERNFVNYKYELEMNPVREYQLKLKKYLRKQQRKMESHF